MSSGSGSARGSLPPKLYFRIGEVASLVGVEPHVLRYWEREFRSIRPTKSAKGQRVYSRRDVENLMRVRDLLYAEGFTIAGAKKKLQKSGVEPNAALVAEAAAEAAALAAQDSAALARSATQAANALSPGAAQQEALRLGVALHTSTAAHPASPLAESSSLLSAQNAAHDAAGEAGGKRMRTTLLDLRTEIEAFLRDL